MLSNHCPVCLSVCLSVTLVYCGQTFRQIKMKLSVQVGLGPAPSTKRGQSPPSQFAAHFQCGQTAGCIKIPLGMEVGLIMLDGDLAPPPRKKGHSPQFSAHVYCGYGHSS